MSFLAELKRRNVIRVGISYLIVAWVIAQVSALALESFGAPAWVIKTVLFTLVVCFPLAMIFAWAFDLTPDGLRLTLPATPGTVAPGNTRLDYVLIVGLVLVAALTLWRGLPGTGKAPPVRPNQGSDMAIAVLPFTDMSPEGDQEYFGDGMAEQLLDDLTRLDGLRVAGRTSSFSFKDSDEDVVAIAEALNVDYVLEGSIRKDGQRVRVTAQLIGATDGYHLWSDIYERELDDIFAVQDEIASSVAGALGVRLRVGDVNAFRGAGTSSVDAYEAYLKALQFDPLTRSTERISMLETAIELDPGYAAAWAELGLSTASTMWTNPVADAPSIVDRAIEKLQTAIDLEPNSAYAKSLLATVNYAKLDWIRSQQYYMEALSMRVDADTLRNYGNMLMRSGRSTDALSQYAQADAIEKLPAIQQTFPMIAYTALGEYDRAEAIIQQYPASLRRYPELILALNRGSPAEVRTTFESQPPREIYATALLTPVLETFDSPDEVRSVLRTIFDDETLMWPNKQQDVALLAAYFGDAELALRAVETEVRHTTIRMGFLWFPVMSAVRELPGFKDLMVEINLVEYWSAYGWGDHCKPLADGDFFCE